jgi:hypothetical protein
MRLRKVLLTVGRKLIDESTLAEIKRESKHLRFRAPESVLADLVDARVRLIESHWKRRVRWGRWN